MDLEFSSSEDIDISATAGTQRDQIFELDLRFAGAATSCPRRFNDFERSLRYWRTGCHDLEAEPDRFRNDSRKPPDLQADDTGPAALARTVGLITEGAVVAIKGIGGFHLAADAGNEGAVRALRQRKHRDEKPFAVMVPDLASAHSLGEIGPAAEAALTDHRKPIVLLPHKPDTLLVPSIAPGNKRLGVMLPYTPLHQLLLDDLRRPIVLTSANMSSDPIVYRDDEARRTLHTIADACLTHDRPIHTRTDDSVISVFRDKPQLQRRSRGYAPEQVIVDQVFPCPILACGGELKNTFCLAKGNRAFISHHIGDLENYETFRSFTEGITHYRRLFDIDPAVVAHDLHPDYLSTKYALEMPDVDLVGVQHHHAHIASCLADNRETGPVLGVAFDGTGYGTDGILWGGEFLLADHTSFERRGHLAPVPMPGGTAAVRQPWRMAAAYLGDEETAVAHRNEDRWSATVSMARTGTNSPLTSSAGRLFDAVAALLGVRDTSSYEGQAAIELEQMADTSETLSYPADIQGAETFLVSGVELVLSCLDDLRHHVPREAIAMRFHNGVADMIVRVCAHLRDSTGVRTVALSGGVFQNALLLTKTADQLQSKGFRVLTHSTVPANDGGISLGQAVVAGAKIQHSMSH